MLVGLTMGKARSFVLGFATLLSALLLAVFLVCSLVPSTCFAAETDVDGAVVNEDVEASCDDDSLVPVEQPNDAASAPVKEEVAIQASAEINVALDQEELDALPNNDELFSGYVENVFYGDPRITTFGNVGEQRFTGAAGVLYSGLKAKCKEVAEGTRDLTEFSIYLDGEDAKVGLTEKKLGFALDFTSSDESNNRALGVLMDSMFGNNNFNTVLSCLLFDCPYDLYWFDKTTQPKITATLTKKDGVICLEDGMLHCSLCVSKDYSESGTAGTFEFKTTRAVAAKAAAAYAQQIVNEYEGKSDFQKLRGYKEAICDLVDYNDAAAADPSHSYGDPWQLVCVFDGDHSTKVVCEGYAKAFQYLCDLSDFSDCTSYIVTGYLDSSRNYPHMWNIVRIGGSSYLVDVTNCDAGKAGYIDDLFLVGTTTGSVAGGYSFNGLSIKYFYDIDTRELYGDELLTLAREDYFPVSIQIVSSGTVTYGYASGEARAGLSVSAGDSATCEYQWYEVRSDGTSFEVNGANSSAYDIPEARPVGNYRFFCSVTFKDTDGLVMRIKKSPVALLQVTRKKVRVNFDNDSIKVTSKVYDGNANIDTGLRVSLEQGDVLSGDDLGVKVTSSYFNSANADEANSITSSIALTGAAAGNYALNYGLYTISGSAVRINPKPFDSTVTLDLATSNFTYSGSVAPVVTILKFGGRQLTSGVDYSVTYSDEPVNAGEYRAIVTGIGNYSGERSASFTINPAMAYAPASDIQLAYNGAVQSAVPASGTYSATGHEATKVGSYKAKVALADKTNYRWASTGGTDDLTVSYSIVCAPISSASVTIGDMNYTGSKLKPIPVVRFNGKVLVAGKDYKVSSYKNNKDVGSATVNIIGLGNFKGTLSAAFKINPKGTSLSGLSPSKKGFTANWAKQKTKMSKKQVTGYQVRYSTAASMKSAKTKTVKGSSKSSLKIAKLKAKKAYYVQVRTYVVVKGKTYYSTWSSTKRVTTRK